MGNTYISNNLKKTSDRIDAGGQVINIVTAQDTEDTKVAERTKKEKIKELEEQLKQLKGDQ